MALVGHKSFSIYTVITYVHGSSPLPSHELPEKENKVIHLYINLVLKSLVFPLCALSLYNLKVYNFIQHLNAGACSADFSVSSLYPCLPM